MLPSLLFFHKYSYCRRHLFMCILCKIPCITPNNSRNFHWNPFMIFRVILLTDKQTQCCIYFIESQTNDNVSWLNNIRLYPLSLLSFYIAAHSPPTPPWQNENVLLNVPFCLQIFHSNADATEVVLNRIPQPVLARFVRIRPQTWKNGIALRFELYGCQITGKKDDAFFSVVFLRLSWEWGQCPRGILAKTQKSFCQVLCRWYTYFYTGSVSKEAFSGKKKTGISERGSFIYII